MRARRRLAWRAIAVAYAAAGMPELAHAASPPCTGMTATSARTWDEPLNRVISLNARDVALRTALDQLSAAARTAFAYSPDLVALDRRVCLVADDRPLGDLLSTLLSGTGIAPTVVAGRVVLGPQLAEPTAPLALASRGGGVDVLQRVVVTGNAVATVRRPLTMAVEIVDGDRLRRQSLTSFADVLNTAAPGAWMWAPSPGSLLAQYSGIRGTSSFGSSAPKIYVDGIEAANPLLATRIDPDAIDHIEIIRGPQGSALYGTDAISGVVNIISRHDGAAPSGERLTFSSAAGATGSAYGEGLVPTHEQRVALRTGTNLRSAALAAQLAQTGAIFPGVSTRDVTLSGDVRAVGSTATWSGTARYLDRRAGAGQNPLLRGLAPVAEADTLATLSAGDPAPQVAREYTIGSSAAIATTGAFTHSVQAGIDGYRLDHVVTAGSLYPVPADSSLRATQGSGDRTTFRVSTMGRFAAEGSWPATTLAVGVEHSVLRQSALASTVAAPAGGARYPTARDGEVEQWNHDAGLFTQLSAAWSDAYFLSAGLRVERNDAFTGGDRRPLLPMLGAAAVRDIGPASIKVRAAYGKGIRPPSSPARGTMAQRGFGIATSGSLDPEVQSGTEAGMEVYVGSVASLQLTRFDQVAAGLVQNVLVGVDTQMHAGRAVRHMLYQLQNVGEIGNHGWELQGSLTRGAASVSSALTRVDSRVRTVARGYGGDLRAGDEMLGVPDRTMTATATWAPAAWSAAVSVSRASRWINYDRLALARDYAAAGATAHDIGGARLRGYWMTYSGDTHLRVSVTRTLHGTLELLAVGDNLLGGQLGEPDNVTIRAGRMVTAGLRAGF